MMIDKVKFEDERSSLISDIKSLSKDERDTLWGIIHKFEDDTRPRYSCKRGDVVKFWSTWTDTAKHIYLERVERIAIALNDCDGVRDNVMLEYLCDGIGGKGGCWRYTRVDAENFLGVIGYVDLSEWEVYTEKLWEVVKHE